MGKSTLLQLLQLAGGSTTAPQESRAVPVPEKALGILRRCGASRYGRPSPQEATEALVRVLDAFQAAPKILNLGSSSGVVPSTDDIALKMEERPIGFSQARDWSPYLRDAAWRAERSARRGTALPELPDAFAAAGLRGPVPGRANQTDVRGRWHVPTEAAPPARVVKGADVGPL